MKEPSPAVVAAHDEDEISLFDLLQTVVENLRLLVLAPLAVGLLALGISFFIPPTFTATTQFFPPQRQQSVAVQFLPFQQQPSAPTIADLETPAEQLVAFLKSRSMEATVVKRFQTITGHETDSPLEFSSYINSSKEGLITVSVDHKDAAFAAQLANAYVEELGLLLNRLAMTEAQYRRIFFEKQLTSAKDNLIKAEQALKASGVNSGALKANPEAAIEGLAQLKASITAQEVRLTIMGGYLTKTAPAFKQAQTELSALRAQVSRAEREEPASASDSDYVAKFRDFKYFETLFELSVKHYEIAKIDESREGAVIQVVDVAQPPKGKSKPKKALIAVLATLTTGFVLLLFVFVRQALRNAAQDAESAAKLSRLRQAWGRVLGRRASIRS